MSGLELHIVAAKGAVIVTFGRSLTWLDLPPAAARSVARTLLKFADEIDPPVEDFVITPLETSNDRGSQPAAVDVADRREASSFAHNGSDLVGAEAGPGAEIISDT